MSPTPGLTNYYRDNTNVWKHSDEPELKAYHVRGNVLSIDGGIVLRGSRVVVPQSDVHVFSYCYMILTMEW